MKKIIILLFLVTVVLFLSQCSKGDPNTDEEYMGQSDDDDPDFTSDSALVQAELIEAELGPIPTFNCEDGILIPIYVDGIEVFEDQAKHACDNPDLYGDCLIGSRIGRIEGTYEDGSCLGFLL
ncbi:MAG: hypothetical protein ACI8YQ_002581 [Polaribacter sp.]|jgi:hypothetical protein